MMHSHFTPSSIHPPFARYSHGVMVHADSDILFCSGQLGIDADSAVPEHISEQAALCFDNIKQVLVATGMTDSDVVRINAYLTDREYISDYMQARDEFIWHVNPPPASTLLIVSGFTREEFKVEVEVIAASACRENSE